MGSASSAFGTSELSGKERPSEYVNYKVGEVLFSPDGTRLAVSLNGGLVCLDATAGKEVWRNELRIGQIAFSPTSKS